tara:strand:- start:1189 stop:2790 length:1602 start_codon:yes stop_codon:yes gene_type:complete
MFNNSKIILPLVFLFVSSLLFVLINKNNLRNVSINTRDLNLFELNNADAQFLNESGSNKNFLNIFKIENKISEYYNEKLQHENFNISPIYRLNVKNDPAVPGKMIRKSTVSNSFDKSIRKDIKDKNKAAIAKYGKDYNAYITGLADIRNEQANLRCPKATVEKNDKVLWVLADGNNNIHSSPNVNSSELNHESSTIGLKDITMNNSWLWGITNNEDIYYCKKPCNNGQWTKINGALVQISAGKDYVIGVNSSGGIFKRNIDSSGDWIEFTPNGVKFINSTASEKNNFYALSSNNEIWKISSNSNNSGDWHKIKYQPLIEFVSLSAEDNYLWAVDINGNPNRLSLNKCRPNGWVSLKKPGRNNIGIWSLKGNSNVSYLDASSPHHIFAGDGICWTYKCDKPANGCWEDSKPEPGDWKPHNTGGGTGKCYNKIIGDTEYQYEKNKSSGEGEGEIDESECVNQNNIWDINKPITNTEIIAAAKDHCSELGNKCAGFHTFLNGRNHEPPQVCYSTKSLAPITGERPADFYGKMNFNK